MSSVREMDLAIHSARPPRAVVWMLLLASAAAVLLVGLVATSLIFSSRPWVAPPWTFWPRLGAACVLTIASLGLRSLRWIFLLRRSEARIPIRDAYIAYFAGFSLLFAPFLLGEIAVRAAVHRTRGRVPILTTAVVNIWERAFDFVALAIIAAGAQLMTGRITAWTFAALAAGCASGVPVLRRLALRVVVAGTELAARVIEPTSAPAFDRLPTGRTWLVALSVSVAAWLLPGVGFWLLAGSWGPIPYGVLDAEYAYAASATASGVMLAPGGVLVAGQEMLAALSAYGIPDARAVLIVLGVRMATVGISIAFGVVFVLVHFRSPAASSASHFDDIADAYDVQIPERRRLALLDRKTSLMREVLKARGAGPRGLDVGCGQGAYVARMRTLGFDVTGIDASAGQVYLAGRNVGDPRLVRAGSVTNVPAPDESFDFLYIINVLHHLGSIEDQRRAFTELLRVTKPGGLLFVHEINTVNVLFRFYMGYVFPSLNCIDEGVERWLLPHRMGDYTDAAVVDVRYFTFLPEFVPQRLVSLLTPIERMLEASRFRAYSAHFMAVLQKPTPRRTT